MAEVTPGAVAPVVVPATEVAPEIQSTADGITETPEGEDKPIAQERTFTQAELDAINAKTKAQADRRALRAAARVEAERDLYKQQLEELRKPVQTQQPPPNGEPKVSDFKDYEDYLVAKAKHQFRQEQAQERQQREQETSQQRQHRSEADLGQAITARLDAVADDIPDIVDLVRAANGITEPMAHFIADSDLGGKVAHYLATNEKEALRIAGLSAAGQFRELVKLEDKIAAPPKPTNTPAPIVPNKGTSSVVRSLSDLIGGSQEDFEKRRNDRIKAQRARR